LAWTDLAGPENWFNLPSKLDFEAKSSGFQSDSMTLLINNKKQYSGLNLSQ
jgi:hypothetical protein